LPDQVRHDEFIEASFTSLFAAIIRRVKENLSDSLRFSRVAKRLAAFAAT
jgi:methyltransferase-like protein